MPTTSTLLLFAAAATALIVVSAVSALLHRSSSIRRPAQRRFSSPCSGSCSSRSPSSATASGLAAGTASAWLRGNRGFLALQRYVSGTIFVALGAATALSKRHQSARHWRYPAAFVH